MPHDAYKALYIHVPFCVSRCAYCDFVTEALPAGDARIDAYGERLVGEIRRASREGELAEIRTVYIGGGTPTHAGGRFLSALLYALGVSMHLTPDVEVTVEANPESLTPELARDLYALGANRLSVGVQTFDDALLALLGRAHTSDVARAAVRAAAERFDNISIDLMCGLPGQTVEAFEADLRAALELPIAHISIYPLTIERKTPLAKMIKRGKVAPPDDDLQADMMQAASRILSGAGFERYEVASYARPGRECKHNIAYWSGVPYLGLGSAAATMTQNAERRMRVTDGHVTDDLDARQMAAEDAMLAMRMSRGLSASRVQQLSLRLPDLLKTLCELCELGLVEKDFEGGFRPTELGWLCGNELYGRLFDVGE